MRYGCESTKKNVKPVEKVPRELKKRRVDQAKGLQFGGGVTKVG